MPQKSSSNRTVLVVDDDANIIEVFHRTLAAEGYGVACARDGREAVELLRSRSFDAIVSDISMPGMDGIQLLRTVRERDLDVPVVLVTGDPDTQTAIRAVEYGALRYLVKPVSAKALKNVVGHAVRMHDLARIKREALALRGEDKGAVADRAGLEASFLRAMQKIRMVYQPIVSCSERKTHAYEAFVRSGDPHLSRPDSLLEAAEQLGLVHRLGQAIREKVAEDISRLDPRMLVFVNLHPLEIQDPTLTSPANPLAREARRVVLEVTERARLGPIQEVGKVTAELRARGYRLAIDDLGAGYAGLNSFVQIAPHIVKIDIELARDIDRSQVKQNVVRSMLSLCHDMNIQVVVEGVETREERLTLEGLGADFLQGYYFAPPGEPFPTVPESAFS